MKNNARRFNVEQTVNFLIGKAKRKYFVDPEYLEMLRGLIRIWYNRYHLDAYNINKVNRNTRYRFKFNNLKKFKFFKFFLFFLTKPYILRSVEVSKREFFESFLFFKFRFRHFWYKKIIFKRFYKLNLYWPMSLLKKKITNVI